MQTKPIAILGLSLLAALSYASAQTVPFSYSQDFTGTNGAFPAEWWDASGGFFTPVISEIRNNSLYLSRTAASGTSATRNALYNGAGSTNWADYTVSATFINSSATNRSGLIARWQPDATISSGELKGYLATTFGNKIHISLNSKNNGGFDHDTHLLAVANLTENLSDAQAARMVLTVNGSLLSAFLYIESTSASGTFDKLIGSVSTTDTTYLTGSAGVMTRFTTDGRSTVWDDFTVSGTAVVPEPGSTSIAIALAVCGLLYLRRRAARKG